jgi:hypothetical protein
MALMHGRGKSDFANSRKSAGAGFTAAVRKGEGCAAPAVEETVFFPRLRGG